MYPQHGSLNRGIWKLLETAVRGWAVQLNQPFTIFVGAMYNSNDPTIGNGVVVPHGYYKLVINQATGQVAGWIFPHVKPYVNLGNNLTKFRAPIAQIQEYAGVKFALPPAAKEIADATQIKQLILADFNLVEKTYDDLADPHPIKDKTWVNDWFNFLKINKQQADTVVSDSAYISFRFILQILMNYVVGKDNVDTRFFKFELPTYENKDGKKLKIIPVTSNRYIISSTDKVIFPSNQLPVLQLPLTPKKGEEVNEDDNVITINPKGERKGIINGYNFHTDEKLFVPGDKSHMIKPQGNADVKLGDALNIFIKYEDVVKAWNSTYTRIDFLERILNIINDNGYGLFTLIYGNQNQNF
jgi:hypothetical protein